MSIMRNPKIKRHGSPSLDNLNIQHIRKMTGLDIISIFKYSVYDDIHCIGRYCGAYIIIGRNGKKYIGSSRDIYQRIKNHLSLNRSKKSVIEDHIVKMYMFITKDYRDATILERFFVNKIRGKVNKQLPVVDYK